VRGTIRGGSHEPHALRPQVRTQVPVEQVGLDSDRTVGGLHGLDQFPTSIQSVRRSHH